MSANTENQAESNLTVRTSARVKKRKEDNKFLKSVTAKQDKHLKRLQDISTLKFQPKTSTQNLFNSSTMNSISLNSLFNHELFNHELFNHELFNQVLFNHEIFNLKLLGLKSWIYKLRVFLNWLNIKSFRQ